MVQVSENKSFNEQDQVDGATPEGFEKFLSRLGGGVMPAFHGKQSGAHSQKPYPENGEVQTDENETSLKNSGNPPDHGSGLQENPILSYPEIMNAKEFNRIVSGLNKEKQQQLFRIVNEFAEVATDDSVEPILFRVPKAALSSGAGVVTIPAEKLSPEALAKRREDSVKRAQKYRQNLSPQEQNELREKDRLRKRLARQQK